MKDWKIAWTQRMDGRAYRFASTVKAANAGPAIAERPGRSRRNAATDAAWNPAQFDGKHAKGDAETL